MGTPTNLQPTVSPADFAKFLLHARTSDTDSYVDHNIVCISADDNLTGLPPEQPRFISIRQSYYLGRRQLYEEFERFSGMW
eukprot:scaffold104214_cov35-Attheya_sp.AAC.1